MPPQHPLLPADVTVLERSWLSANNILLTDAHETVLVDSGYCTDAAQTVALVEQALDGRPLTRLLNTHLHSDHCGGNAALQARWPQVRTTIPPGQFAAVCDWDEARLSYEATGQQCPRFRADDELLPDGTVLLAGRPWQVHAAPGHDNDAVLLFQADTRVLISGDALWQNGFGVVFPELDHIPGFAQVGATLDLIEQLQPAVVIPGHGPVFDDVDTALAIARRRLAGFVADPQRHARHAAKVLLKYKLIEWQHIALPDALAWLADTPYFVRLHDEHFADHGLHDWSLALVQELAQAGVARLEDGVLHDS